MIELFRLNRDYKGLVVGINMERNDSIKNNRDLPCLINNDYIDDNNIHVPVVRVSVLVTADNYSDKKLNDVIVTINTDGDLTKNTNVDMTYDKVMMGVTLCIIIMVQWKK